MPIVNIVFGAIVICLVVIGVRFLWIFPLAWVEYYFLRRGEDSQNFMSNAALVVLSWAGMREWSRWPPRCRCRLRPQPERIFRSATLFCFSPSA